jgi:hypothetical protein
VESAPHGHPYRTARTENRQLLTPTFRGHTLRQTAVDSGTEFRPRLHHGENDLSVDPLGDQHLEHFLEIRQSQVCTARVLKRLMQFANLAVASEQPGETMLQHTVSVVFVELLDYDWFGEREAAIAIDGGHDPRGVLLPDTWSRADLVKHHLVSHPVLPQSESLRFSDRGKLVVILIEEGRLCMPNQKKATHALPNGFSMCVDGTHFHAAVKSWL